MSRHSALLMNLFAILFGFWFATHQVQAIAIGALAAYPTKYFLLTIIKCWLTLLAIYFVCQLNLSLLSQKRYPSVWTAMSFTPLLLVYVGCPLYWICILILGGQLVSLAILLRLRDYRRLAKNYAMDAVVLLILFLLHFFLTTRFSPLHWNMALLVAKGFTSEELPVLTPLFKSFVLVKQFSFTDIDYSQWAGIMNPPVSLRSPFLQLLTFILDLPSASYEAFHVVLMGVYFFLCIAGSFGFYLFLKYAAKIYPVFALFGGTLFFLSGAPILEDAFISDGGIFLSSFVVFPYALLLISLAYEKNNIMLALWAGVALATQFFLLTPHPEGTIYSLFFYGVYSSGLCLFTKKLPWKTKLVFAGISILACFLLSAFIVAPILIDRFSGNMYVFAHVGDVTRISFKPFKPYFYILCLFLPLSAHYMYRLNKVSPVYLSSVLMTITLLLLILMSRDIQIVNWLVKHFHVGLHFWVVSRIGMYFYMSTFIIAMFGLEGATYWLSNKLVQITNRLQRGR